MASILKPASEALPLVMKMFPNSKTCNTAAFMDCFWKLPAGERKARTLLSSQCAEQTGCKPEVIDYPWSDADYQES